MILAYSGLTYGASKTLFNNVVGIADAQSSLKRIDELMEAKEYQNKNIDELLPVGTIVIKDLVSSYEPEEISGNSEGNQNRSVNSYELLSSRHGLRAEEEDKDLIKGFIIKVNGSITVQKGERLILLGEPNAGKSELIQSILANMQIH